MKLLLDTHIWLWYLLGNPKLSIEMQQLINAETTELWLSPISIWETIILAEKSKIILQPNTTEWIDRALTTLEVPKPHSPKKSPSSAVKSNFPIKILPIDSSPPLHCIIN